MRTVFFNTPRDEKGNLPDVTFCQESNEKGETWTARDSAGREIIDADKTSSSEIEKLNGRYATNNGELQKDANNQNIPNGAIHDADTTGYQHTTSGGTYEGVTDQVPNNPENVSHSTISGWGKGEGGNITVTPNENAYAGKLGELSANTEKTASDNESTNSDADSVMPKESENIDDVNNANLRDNNESEVNEGLKENKGSEGQEDSGENKGPEGQEESGENNGPEGQADSSEELAFIIYYMNISMMIKIRKESN